jgi:hypothetical protein
MTSSREELYSLSDGKYKFRLESVNEDGLSQGAAGIIHIFIKKPFYRTWWAILLELFNNQCYRPDNPGKG